MPDSRLSKEQYDIEARVEKVLIDECKATSQQILTMCSNLILLVRKARIDDGDEQGKRLCRIAREASHALAAHIK